MVDAIPGRDTEIRLSQHVILISHDITLFSLPYSAHTLAGVLDTTVQKLRCQYNGLGGREKEPVDSVLPRRPCTSLFPNMKPEWVLLDTLNAPRCRD